jgi:hypothetical protein
MNRHDHHTQRNREDGGSATGLSLENKPKTPIKQPISGGFAAMSIAAAPPPAAPKPAGCTPQNKPYTPSNLNLSSITNPKSLASRYNILIFHQRPNQRLLLLSPRSLLPH